MKTNVILNGIRILSTILFPLITFPYVSRVLQVENLGKVNFSNSLISYFLIIASLGIPTYAIREGSRLKNRPQELNNFANQIFTLNLISSIISYIGLFILIPFLKDYRLLLLIHSISIIFTTIGVEWIYSIYEDYAYITLRSLFFQLISMVLLFLFVKDTSDYYIYAAIAVFSNVGSNILNYLNSKRYFNIKVTTHVNFKLHIIPILIIFSTNIATTFYVNSDMTMIGVLVNDYAVGIYSVAVRIYSIIKTLLSSILVVTLPRLAFYISNNNDKEYQSMISKIFSGLLIIILPTVLGLNLIANEIIEIISGVSYLEATVSLRLLSIALLFSIFASFFATSILLPHKDEKYILLATFISAITNVALNVVLIPLFEQDGAALTTILAELIVLIITYIHAKKYMKIKNFFRNLISSIIGCIGIYITYILFDSAISISATFLIMFIIFSIIVYYFILYVLKNELVIDINKTISKIIIKVFR